VAASIAHGFAGRSFKLRRDTRERRTQFCAEAVHSRNDGDGNAGGNQAVFNGRGSRLILYKPNKKLRHSGALGLPSSPGPQRTKFPLSVRKLTYCKLGKANSSNFVKKREFGRRPNAAALSIRRPRQPGSPVLPVLRPKLCQVTETRDDLVRMCRLGRGIVPPDTRRSLFPTSPAQVRGFFLRLAATVTRTCDLFPAAEAHLGNLRLQ
jgi:hypothetical protein